MTGGISVKFFVTKSSRLIWAIGHFKSGGVGVGSAIPSSMPWDVNTQSITLSGIYGCRFCGLYFVMMSRVFVTGAAKYVDGALDIPIVFPSTVMELPQPPTNEGVGMFC